MIRQSDFESLFDRLLNNSCSPEEADRIMALLGSDKLDEEHLEYIQSRLKNQGDPLAPDTRIRLQESLNNIILNSPERNHNEKNHVIVGGRFWRLIAAASVVLVICGVGIYSLNNLRYRRSSTNARHTMLMNDVLPGGSKATLILANGNKIILDSSNQKGLPNQGVGGGINISNGTVSYNPPTLIGKQNGSAQYNTLTTPKGGQYKLELADGTKVWLNAASSIRYPTSFERMPTRQVVVTGEAYFEVAKRSKQPFRVQVGEMQVEVLGTSFDIEAYANQSTIKTTLLEGGVRVTKGNISQVLKPGEQSQLTQNGDLKVVKDADVEAAVAWKNGYFSFDQADLKSVMMKIARWYDVNVVYQGEISPQRFGGEIQKNLTLSQVLTILGKSQISFKIKGDTLTIYSTK